jgi:hypothetical protein
MEADKPSFRVGKAAMWMSQWCSRVHKFSSALQPSPSIRAHRADENLVFGTVRALRSAAGMFYQWDWNVAYPERTVQDSNDRFFLANLCLPTDSIAYTAMTKALRKRIGNNPKGVAALLARHVIFIDKDLDHLYHTSTDSGVQVDAARAGLSNSCGWLCWFRAHELFGVAWRILLVVYPGTGACFELPDHMGGVHFTFILPLKTSLATNTELWCAYTSGSGLSVGKWLHRLRRRLRMSSFADDGATPIFQPSGGQLWTSEYFRQTSLYWSSNVSKGISTSHLMVGCAKARAFLMRSSLTMSTAQVDERM